MQKLMILCLVLLCQGCVTYQKCMDKFSQSISDTVTVTKNVTVTIPHDSIITIYTNDTIPFYTVYKQGRARLTVDKKPKITIIKADCDSTTKVVETKYKYIRTTNHIGIAPKWKTYSYVLLGALVLALLCIVIIYFTKRKRV